MATYKLGKELEHYFRPEGGVSLPDELQPHNPVGYMRVESPYSEINWEYIKRMLKILYKKDVSDLAVGDVLEVLYTPSMSQLRSVAVESQKEETGFTFDVMWNNGINAAIPVAGNQITSVCAETKTNAVAAGDSTGFGSVAANTVEQRVIIAPSDNPAYITANMHGTVQMVITAVPAPWLEEGVYRLRVNFENHEVVRCGGC